MLSENPVKRSAPLALIAFALIGIALAWLSSFRLGFGNIELAWQVNFERLALATAAGIAFASTGALISRTRSHVKNHILGFAVVSAASTALLTSALQKWPTSLIVLSSVAVGGATWFLASFALRVRKSMNLWSAGILAVSFSLTVMNFLIASSLGGGFGKFVYWLQGNLLQTGSYSWLVLFLSLMLFAWILIAKTKDIPACLLFGLGVGVAGSVFFIGCLVPIVVQRLTKTCEGKLFLTSCAALGALFIVLADSIPRLLIGGYSPTLLIPIALVSIPAVLFYQRSMLLTDFPSRSRGIVEAGIILFWLIGFTMILFHMVQFANLAA